MVESSKLVVLNLGRGMPAAIAAKLMRETGARVISVADAHPFNAIYPAFDAWHEGVERASLRSLEALLSRADVCIIGGEDYPDLEKRYSPHALSSANPRLVVLALSGYGEADPDQRHAAVDLLVQARSGLVWEHRADRPVAMACPLPTYGMVLQGVLGVWTALIERAESGQGQVVSTSMLQGAATFWAQYWLHPSNSGTAFERYQPRGVRQLVFKCADGGYIQFALGTPGSLGKLYAVLGIDSGADSEGRGQPDPSRGLKNYFADTDQIAMQAQLIERDALLAAAWQAGLAAEPVLAPGECWNEKQVLDLGLIKGADGGARYIGGPIRCHEAEAVRGVSTDRFLPKQRGPLQGFRIIDFGAVVAGPFASALLADLGAEVIKVEPLTGDFNRKQPRTTAVANRGKLSIAIDAKSAEGRVLISRICASADAVHHNFRVGVAERLGLDDRSLRKLNPAVVTLETSAYGPSGAKSHNPGFDMIMQALCGHEMRAGGIGNEPACCRAPFIDFAAGTLGAIALVRGLYERKVHGRGAAFGTSLIEAGLFLMSELIQAADGQFIGAPLLDSAQCGFSPAESIYRTRDGWIAVAARSPTMFDRFAKAMNLENASRDWLLGEKGWASIREAMAAIDSAEILERLRVADVWCEPCIENGWSELARSTADTQNPMLREVTERDTGDATGWFGPLFSLSRTRLLCAHTVSPGLGEHNAAVLGTLGHSEEEVTEMSARGVIASRGAK